MTHSNAVQGSDSQQHTRTPVFPTVTGHREEGDELILETLDPRPETDLYTNPLEWVGNTKTEEQQEVLALHERN